MADRLPLAGLLLGLAGLLVAVGLWGTVWASYLYWGGGLLCSVSMAGQWLVEDLGMSERLPLPRGIRRLSRLSHPLFWMFPLMMIHAEHPQTAWVVAAVLVVVQTITRVAINQR
ncbi:MAG: hypothetical protein R3E66_20160 [bacterium]